MSIKERKEKGKTVLASRLSKGDASTHILTPSELDTNRRAKQTLTGGDGHSHEERIRKEGGGG